MRTQCGKGGCDPLSLHSHLYTVMTTSCVIHENGTRWHQTDACCCDGSQKRNATDPHLASQEMRDPWLCVHVIQGSKITLLKQFLREQTKMYTYGSATFAAHHCCTL